MLYPGDGITGLKFGVSIQADGSHHVSAFIRYKAASSLEGREGNCSLYVSIFLLFSFNTSKRAVRFGSAGR